MKPIRKPKVKSEEGEKIPSFVERFKFLKMAIDRKPGQTLPGLSHIYRSFSPDGLQRLLLEIDPDTSIVTISSINALASKVLNLLQEPAYVYNPWWEWDYERALKFARWYQEVCELVPEPKPFRWQGEDGPCYHRLPWHQQVGDTTLWDAFLGRLSNAQPFCDWLGSLFVEGAYMQDYVWIQGMGDDGKGVLNRFLYRVFGAAYRATQPPKSEHWSNGLIGKRLVVFPDCANTKFVTSGDFKSLTGGDPIEINPKYQNMFTYFPKAKYLFFSNERPDISSERADVRRLILCEFDPKASKIDSDDFEAALWREGGAFLAKCILGYAERSKGFLPVVQTEEGRRAVDELVSTLEEDFEVMFDKTFHRSPTASLVPADLDMVLKAWWGKDRVKAKEFRNWMERRYGIRKRTRREKGLVLGDRYCGLGLRYDKDRTQATKADLLEGEKARYHEALPNW